MNQFQEDIPDLTGFGIKKTSIDKLTYKNIIAYAFKYCLVLRGSSYFNKAVLNLESTIKFDVIGYKFETAIQEIKKKLMEEKKEIISDWKKELGRSYHRTDNQALMKLSLYEWGWNAYFQELVQLLATNNLLLETQKLIPVQIKHRMKDEEYDEET